MIGAGRHRPQDLVIGGNGCGDGVSGLRIDGQSDDARANRGGYVPDAEWSQ
jgi:hypothetical protein